MKIQVLNQASIRVEPLWVRRVLRFMLAEGYPSADQSYESLSVVFLDRKEARRVNLHFRKKDYATDVLSFSPIEPESLGELVLCPQVIKMQAKQHKLSFEQELGYLLIHGVLHLLGFEHEGQSAVHRARARKMMKLQDQLFDRLCKKFDLN